MVYDPNIPMATDLLSQSQSDIQSNFAAIKALIDINHATFGNAQQGKHKYVELPVQSIPPIVFDAGEVAVYSGLNAQTNRNELYINKTNQATVVQIPSTASTLSLNSTPNNGDGAWSYLPSGLVIISDGFSGNTPGGFTGIVTVTIAIPITLTRLLSVVVSPFNGSTTNDINFAVRLIDITSATTFRIFVSSRTNTGAYASSSPFGYKFFAIAKPNI